MEQSKSPKSLAYARLGKNTPAVKTPLQEAKKIKRNSAGNIYEEIMGGLKNQQTEYIRGLVQRSEKDKGQCRNEKEKDRGGRQRGEKEKGDRERGEKGDFKEVHGRRKSYADLQVNLSRDKREERQTLGRPKYNIQNLLQQATPKNGLHMSKKSDFFGRKEKREEKSFLASLTNYIEQLNEEKGHQKLSETLKFAPSLDENSRLGAKLEQAQAKIKELRLRNHFLQKDVLRQKMKEENIKSKMYEMYQEIKFLDKKVTEQRKERKKIERLLEGLEQKKERRTIGKSYKVNYLQENQGSDNSNQLSDLESSFRQYCRNRGRGVLGCSGKKRDEDRLNEERIESMFRSHFRSDQSID